MIVRWCEDRRVSCELVGYCTQMLQGYNSTDCIG